MAAGVAAIALTAALAFAAKVSWLDHTLQTQGSEWRSVPLSDGSSVTAAPYTKLRHDISARQRVVTLARGLAVFRVASDPSRPFLVEAGGIVVQATGTQFTVERRKDRVTVTTTEGSVVVRPSEGAAATFDTVPLVINQQLTITDAGAPAVDEVDAEKERQRAEGKLIFKPGDTISNAVEQFNEFNVIKIEVDDATGARPMRGSFDAIDPLSFAASVQRATGSPWVWESSERLRIGPEEPGSR